MGFLNFYVFLTATAAACLICAQAFVITAYKACISCK